MIFVSRSFDTFSTARFKRLDGTAMCRLVL